MKGRTSFMFTIAVLLGKYIEIFVYENVAKKC